MKDVIDILSEKAHILSKAADPKISVIRGITQSHYVLRLTEYETLFDLDYILVQTVGQGCCYFDPRKESPEISVDLVGQDILILENQTRCLRIAALDAMFASFNGPPTYSCILDGTNIEKAAKRAQIVCDEVARLATYRRPKSTGKLKVLNVGVVGGILFCLKECREYEVKACDFFDRIVNHYVNNVFVENGSGKSFNSRTLELIAESDIAVVTGMTLANGTLSSIIETAFSHQTALVIFAETGANFASEYRALGVDVVVSEPYPFYLISNGPTNINVYS